MSIESSTRQMHAGAEWLEWDSAHFGWRVGRLPEAPDLDTLRNWLMEARQQHYDLLYYFSSADALMDEHLLREFGGWRGPGKVTYACELVPTGAVPVPDAPYDIQPYPCAAPTSEMVALALVAGKYSRFQSDPRIPPDDFRRMYRTWIERSALLEIASVVLVARDESGKVVALVTVRLQDGQGTIGLIAVDEACRGRGLGRAMVAAAQLWLISQRATKLVVVTQAENAPARRIYERSGCTLVRAEQGYHFWPQAAASAR